MENPADPGLTRRLNFLASACSLFSVAAGISGLSGWWFQLHALNTWGIAPVKMVANTAACFVLLGVALWLRRQADRRPFEGARRLAARACSAVAVLVGVLSLVEHIGGRGLGIDQLLVLVPASDHAAGVRPGLMSWLTATDFALLGGALLLLDWRTRRGGWPAQFFGLAAVVPASFGLFALVLEPHASPTSMSWPTAATFFVLIFGVVCSRPGWAMGGLLASPTQGARFLRRATPVAVLATAAVWLFLSRPLLSGSHFNWVEVSVLAVVCIGILASFISRVAVMVERGEIDRRAAEAAKALTEGLNAELERRVAQRTSELRQSESRFAGIIQSAMDAVITVDEQRRIVVFNGAAETMFRCPQSEALGQSINRFIPQRFHALHDRHVQEFARTGVMNRLAGSGAVLSALRADGQEFPIQASISRVIDGEGQLFTVIVRDMTEPRRTERALSSLSACNDLLIRARDEATLLQQVCELVVHVGGYRMAWVGYPVQDGKKSVGVAAQGGFEEGYLESLNLTWADEERGRGPTGTAIRTGRMAVCRDIASDPNFSPWRERAMHLGYRASLVLPLKQEDRLLGVLSIYSAEAGAFDPDEQNLLGKLAENLSYGIGALRAKAESSHSSEIRERLAAIVDSSDDAIISKDLNGIINAWNRGAEKIYGYSAEEVLGKTMTILFPPERVSEEADILERVRRGESVPHFETERVRKDGSRIDVSVAISPIRDASGKVVGASKIARDITERKLTEHLLRESEENFRRLWDTMDEAFCTIEVLFDESDKAVDYRFLEVNPAFTKNTGIKDAWGKRVREINPRQDEEWYRIFGEVARTGKAIRFEKEEPELGRWFEVHAFRAGDPEENRVAILFADISERKRAEEALREQAKILNLAQVLVRDMDDRIVQWSQGAEKLYGFSREEAVGRVSHDLLRTEFPEPLAEIEARMAEAGSWEGELSHRRRDGSPVVVASVWVLHRDAAGRPLRVLEANNDITDRKRAEQALRDSQRFLQSTVDALSAHIAILDEHGKILGVNAAWRNFSEANGGCAAACGIGSNYLSVCEGDSIEGPGDADLAESAKAGIRRLITGAGSEFSFEYACHGPQERRWVMMRATSFLENGKVRVVVAHENITSLKLAEERLAAQAEKLSRQADELRRSQQSLEAQTRMLKLVLESMGEGLVAADLTGKFLLWNGPASKLLSRDADNLPPEQWSSHYACYLADGITPCPTEELPLVRALRGESLLEELIIRQGEEPRDVFLEFSGHPMRDAEGNVCGGVVAFRDISERKAAERKLQELYEELEARVVARTAQLEAANRELESFTYSVSHDLRAPLRHIGGFSRILMEDFGGELSAEAQCHLGRIEDGVKRMGQLVDELLNLARVGRHAVKLQPTNLNQVVEEVVSMLQPEVQERKVTWKIASLPLAECDPVLVRQVFQNLMANALKFTRPRECAEIEIASRLEKGQMVISVADNGVGFDMAYVDKLFGVFQRLHRAEHFEGTGIGLATVQRIVQKHGGRIWAEAEVGKGATFFFTLQVAGEREGDAGEGKAASAGKIG